MKPEPGKEENQRLRAAVESSPSGLLMIDGDGRMVLVNREIERLFGYPREELLGRVVDMLIPARFRAPHPELRAGFFARPSVRAMGGGRELHGLRKDGSEVPVEIGLTPVATEEGLFVLSSIVDISARKEAEAERAQLEEQLQHAQKMEALGRLAGGVAHDFNNILGAVIGFAELARAPAGEPQRLEDIDELIKAATRGKALVERILRFSRNQKITRRPLGLARLVTDSARLLRAALPAAVDIQLKLAPSAAQVLADPTSVQQVLMNLATNASDAMAAGGTLVIALEEFYARDSFVRAHPGLPEGPYLQLTVRDTGTGMDSSTAARAFEPFFTTKPHGKGTGLGLSMVHGIMRDHGGAVWLESEAGRGTAVRCLFPVLAEGEDGAEEPAVILSRGQGERILYVDDQDALLTVSRRRLENLGYRVTALQSPQQALETFAARPMDFDLVITDYSMPKMSGLELAAALTSIRSGLPILLVTGYMEDFPVESIASAGIRRVLKKPLTLPELAAAARQFLPAPPEDSPDHS